MGFTYFGDLLGISSNYNLEPTLAYSKLNDFYNITFSLLKDYSNAYQSSRVFMFSDSLLFYGDDTIGALNKLQNLYLKLMNNNLLIKGAMVNNKLDFDPRFELENFEKRLPINNTLANAVGIQSMYKGARLIIDKELAKELLLDVPQWLTQEGFVSNKNKTVNNYETLIRICPTPDNNLYEYLYFWQTSSHNVPFDHKKKKKELEEISKMVNTDIGTHYKETIDLIKRCQTRELFVKTN